MARRGNDFQTIRSEGGLLPSDLLRRILDPRENVPGTNAEDYGLPHGERLNETITQSWNRLRRHWTEFRQAAEKLPEGEPGTGLTNDRWNLPLLRELGFGPVPVSSGPEIGGRSYAINRFLGPVPVHLIGCGLSLDHRAAGVRGAAAANPHGLVQDFLNRAEGYLWGIVSNGFRFRILRDNKALSRQCYLEFDLEAMFDGEVFSDFVLLWLTAHATRFTVEDGARAETCRLEQWTKLAEEQGTRALESLKEGVEKALEVLGQGLVGHPHNTALRESLRTGTLSLSDFHSQLLRVVYRLIFLFVAEDRTLEGLPLLHPRDASEEGRRARERYSMYYSTGRLRDLSSRIRGSRHGDLWQQFNLLVGALSGDNRFALARDQLALPNLGSFLWSPESTVSLNAASLTMTEGTELTNTDFLEAIRHLAYTRQGNILRPVDYRNLGSEELGGVYESLLALTPQISGDGTRFSFAEFAGNERKTSGSYYTPDSLVQCLLDSALDPVVEEAIKGKTGRDAERAILSLKVCDPAVGSGHFLVGAAHRLARHLARARAIALGESEPSPPVYQHAIRDVISHCLYGVDISPMAAELCRVSLWLEALEPGKPLSFLDHHIRVGNSLLGTTPELIAQGIPDDAFKPIEGDDKKACAELKKRNRAERRGWGPLFERQEAEIQVRLAKAAAELEELPDDRPDDIQFKELMFRDREGTGEYRHKKLLADAWCAAFVMTKHFKGLGCESSPVGITQGHLNDLAGGRRLPVELWAEIERLAGKYAFFHWNLAFPEVFTGGGFDVSLGNPPWGQIQFEPEEFFAGLAPSIAKTANTDLRNKMIAKLQVEDPQLFSEYTAEIRRLQAHQLFVHASGRFPTTSYGRLNTAPLFCEACREVTRSTGRIGIVVPTGIATDSFNQFAFQNIVSTHSLFSLFSFENEEFIFPAVHHATKFCLFTCGSAKGSFASTSEFIFFARQVEHLKDPERVFRLSSEDIRLLNPNTQTCPIFRYNRDAELTKAFYRRVPVLINENPKRVNPWGITFQLMFMMNTDSHRFRTREQLEVDAWDLDGNVFKRGIDHFLPLYEGKMIHHFDHRWGTYDGQTQAQANQGKLPELDSVMHADSQLQSTPHYWVSKTDVEGRLADLWPHDWLLGWRDITGAAVLRTVICSMFPRVGAVNNLPLILSNRSAQAVACLTANLNSYVLDYIARQKVGGSHINFYLIQQFPVLPPENYDVLCLWGGKNATLQAWLLPMVLELIYTAWDMKPFASDCSHSGPPFRWDEGRRFLLRCELDAAFFHLYLGTEEDWNKEPESLTSAFPTPRHALDYVMETFPIVKRKDEAAYGTYRTKDTILEIYDALTEAIRTGRPYQTRLDPPPGPPADEQGNFLPLPEWQPGQPRPANWPSHIHQPREVPVVKLEEIPLGEFAAMAYPAAEIDRTICAIGIAIVEQWPGLSSQEHLDSLLLATHMDWCKVFLPDNKVRGLEAAYRNIGLSMKEGQSVKWNDCRDYLEQKGGISINRASNDQVITIGSNVGSLKAILPAGAETVTAYAIEAMKQIIAIRQDMLSVSQTQLKTIEILEDQNRLYNLAG